MSSFKRKVPTVQAARGTQLSPSSTSTTLISTGIPSLDDILGGGLPLSCSLLITGPDYHSSYNELVQRYFVSQGLDKEQNVILIHHDAGSFTKECMWTPAADTSRDVKVDDADNHAKIKIAWRYEEMKQFQTTVTAQFSEDFCSIFDLTCRIPELKLDRALKSNQLRILDVPSFSGSRTMLDIVEEVERLLAEDKTSTPLRICIPAFGSLDWGDITSNDVTIFLYRLQVLLRCHPHACASITLVPHMGLDLWGGSGWTQKLGWLSDAFIKLSAFSSNPALSALSPSHHGLLEIHALPSPHTLISPSDKHSVLRGLSSAAMSAGGSGENNLAFKCTRKRLIFETLHLDVEGGVGERRTTPSSSQNDPHVHQEAALPKAAFASVGVSIERPTIDTSENRDAPLADLLSAPPPDGELSHKVKKPKKRVAFHSDRPDLYDF